MISSPRPYVGADNHTFVIPLVEFESERFYARGITAGMKLVERDGFAFAVEARAQFAGFDENDSPFLEGMREREETVELGVTARRRLGSFELGASVHADALGRSDGVSASINVERLFVADRGRAGLTPWVGASWHDADFVDYYAGVRPDEARAGRPAYRGESTLNYQAGLRAFSKLGERVTGLFFLQAEKLADEFERSPIIENDWGYFALVGVSYTF